MRMHTQPHHAVRLNLQEVLNSLYCNTIYTCVIKPRYHVHYITFCGVTVYWCKV